MSVTEGGSRCFQWMCKRKMHGFQSSRVHLEELHSSTVCIPKMPGGTVMHTREIPQANTSYSITARPLLRTKIVNLEQYANAHFWIDLIARGILMWWREMHAQNAQAPILSSPLPRSTLNNPEQFPNAHFLIPLRAQGILMDLMTCICQTPSGKWLYCPACSLCCLQI